MIEVNNSKIDFIICTNDELYYDECVRYISHLVIPTGYTIGVIPIKEAVSMTSAYNYGMQQSDAKYKIYMHQDVFIINKNFLESILAIFNSDDNIGMIGLAGCNDVFGFINTLMWTTGKVYEDLGNDTHEYVFGEPVDYCQKVNAIDGLMMITQYDVEWREDLFRGWHYYDLSQSMEFIKRGYDIVVPKQNNPWVLHDNGVINYNNYYEWQKIFINEYKCFLTNNS